MISRDFVRPPVPEPLPSPVADSHCHLDIADVDGLLDAQAAVSAAASVGVNRIVQIGCDLPSAAWSVDLATRFDAVVAGVSLHPNEAPVLAARGELDSALAEIERLAALSPRVRAVGETGLDYFRTGPEGLMAQEESFRAHIDIAKRLDRTLVIHDRDSIAARGRQPSSLAAGRRVAVRVPRRDWQILLVVHTSSRQSRGKFSTTRRTRTVDPRLHHGEA